MLAFLPRRTQVRCVLARQKKRAKIAAPEFETSATMGAGASVEGDAPKPKFV